MNVIFLMISYPDVSQNTNLYTDLVLEFKQNNHNVYVVAPSFLNKNELKKEEGIFVLRVKSGKLFNVNPVIKGISNVRLPYQFTRTINKYLKGVKIDLIITPTPPITFYSTIISIKKKNKCKSYLILRDIFPQNAKDLGILNNSVLFNYFRKKEKQIYGISDYIGCMSQANIDFVKRHNPEVKDKKLHLLPNWIKAKTYSISEMDYKKKYGLKEKFVAIYGGNIGLPQKAEFILDLAESVKDIKDIVFLIIGQGTHKNKLKSLLAKINLTNVEIRDYLPREDYQELVKQCDIGLVNLSDKFTIPNIPSRTLAYFEAKLPILAAIDKNTDYGKMLQESKAGLWSITGDLESYKKNLLILFNNSKLRKEMGEDGYKYLFEKLNVEEAYNTIISNV
ncbi:MAG: glycosyltransferase family 4 protein [Bacteroidales bacterium]|nr:glycosyltransferase family 4 protein [Bacteroidales bacterium]